MNNAETDTMAPAYVNARSFTGESLREIGFPIGGIGTGTVSLGGRGQLRDWEIFNRPGKGRDLPYTFFSVWAQRKGEPATAFILERQAFPPYTGGFGLPTSRAAGLPRLSEAKFTGFYPYAWIDFEDARLPLTVKLEAFNPFVPLDAEASGLPGAVFRWKLRNDSADPVSASVAFSLLNAVGYGGTDSAGNPFNTGNRHAACFGQNLNEFVDADGVRGLRMSSAKYPNDDPRFGTMAIATDWPSVTYLTHWERAGWWDDLQNFWDAFSSGGRFADGPAPSPSPDGQTDVGSLGLLVDLDPGQEALLPFVLSWHFPNLTNYWNQEESVRSKRLGNYYCLKHEDAWAAGQYLLKNLERLERPSREYVDSLASSTLPPQVIDAVSSQASIIRTTTCLRTEDGRFHAFEGCGDHTGCCPLNCTHVWNYEQSLAHLFPDLERTMRETDFGCNTDACGNMRFRTLVPLAEGALWSFVPAADGQMGTVLKLYREWKLSGDTEWLSSLWPAAKRSLEFAWSPENRHGWDADRDGVMEGIQHNTYDIEFCGPNTMMGSWYLAALRAGAAMADAVGDAGAARSYRELADRGREGHAPLFNGEYYVQHVRFDASAQTDRLTNIAGGIPLDGDEPRYQYGPGCLSDQVLGQWFAHCVGLGYVLPADQVQSAVRAIYRHNFRRDFSEHANCQRIYALNDEAGLLLCSWPNGGRPRYPFPYADEVWTGIEYQVAAHLIFEGFVDEGLEVVKAVRDRYDGLKRNPWDEVECGHHYARAMSSWSLLLALSGFHYDAVAGSLAFAPRIHADRFRCLFTTGSGWGVFRQSGEGQSYRAEIEVKWGNLKLKEISPSVGAVGAVNINLNGRPIRAAAEGNGRIALDPSIRLNAGDLLSLSIPVD